MGLIDTHLHLDDLEQGPEAVAREAREAGVTDLIAMGVDGATSRLVAGWAGEIEGVWAAAGHHPLNQEGPDLALLREVACEPRVVAVGEVGLDAFDQHRGPEDAQRAWFGSCCELALELDLPVCVHIRGTEQEVWEELRRHQGIRGVIHYWSLTWEWAQRFLALGFYLSFAGTITRATKEQIRDVARRAPADRLLLETDSPWGTPRGRSGAMRPAWMVDTARTLAEVRGIELPELDRLQRENALRLFSRLGA